MNDRYSAILVVGIILPYVSNYIGGIVNDFSPVMYFDGGIPGFVFLEIFNMTAVVSAIASSVILKGSIIPTTLGYLSLAGFHFFCNLSKGHAITIAFIPIYCAIFIWAITAVMFFTAKYINRKH